MLHNVDINFINIKTNTKKCKDATSTCVPANADNFINDEKLTGGKGVMCVLCFNHVISPVHKKLSILHECSIKKPKYPHKNKIKSRFNTEL